ncbi:Signal transduction histidine kinase CheA [hydrothermal vent metagenome]|uniref:histidine kinase n=1 Tax=hydrothermal vent metagenome TaxID=652676 RepID=A0A3B1CK70_9ZZZZ
MSEVDNEIFQSFLEEADDLLNDVEIHSTALESSPDDMSHVDSIFRAVHSLKGNSSFFGFTEIQGFCHSFESFMGLIREKTIAISPNIVGFILEGADHLKAIFTRINNTGGEVGLQSAENDYLNSLNEKIDEYTEENRLDKLRLALLSFFARMEATGEMEGETSIREIYELINGIAPELIHDRRKSLKAGGSRWMRGELDVTREYVDLIMFCKSAEAGEEILNAYDSFTASINSLIQKHVEANDHEQLEILENLKEGFEIFYQEELGVDETIATIINEFLSEYEKGLKEVKPGEEKSTPAQVSNNGNSSEKFAPGLKTIKINESLLDKFIEHVGELITINELFNNLQRSFGNDINSEVALNFKNTNLAFHELSEQMRVSLYEIRKAPLERALSKLPRIVRDIARSKGKSIALKHSGGEIEVDKGLHGKIETMLVHCVRNSADHGLELAEERRANGKNPEGTISIDVTTDRNRVFISIADDGRGVDLSKTLRHAVERGFVSKESAQTLSEKEILDLLLTPGFSTAEEVTETSGRGVGMDVLSSSVHEMGGEMSLRNNPGKGLTIKVSLPLAHTARIKLGLTMRVGERSFLVPAERVRESFKAQTDEISMVEGKGEVVRRWGRIYPLVRLSELFDIPASNSKVSDSICLLVESKGNAVCLVVDEMLGQRQIVYKELTVQTKEPNAFDGVSILDARNMALILNIDGIIKQFQE